MAGRVTVAKSNRTGETSGRAFAQGTEVEEVDPSPGSDIMSISFLPLHLLRLRGSGSRWVRTDHQVSGGTEGRVLWLGEEASGLWP